MRRQVISALLLAAFATALAACAASDPMGTSLPEVPNRISTVPVERDHTVFFTGAALNPSASERTRLLTFLHDADARPGDHVDIQAGPSAAAAARQASIAQILGAAGLTNVVATAGPAGSGVVVLLRQSVAVPPAGCAAWPPLGAGDVLNAPASYFGCANANDLYDMVVDKRDLAVGRTPGSASAEPAIEAVRKYREGITDTTANNTPAAPTAAPSAGAATPGTPASATASTSTTGNAP